MDYIKAYEISVNGIVSTDGISGDVSTATLLRIPAFYAGVRALSTIVAPLRVMFLDANKNEMRNHVGYQLLNVRSNDYAGPTKTKETHIVHALTYGNGMCRIYRDKRGRPTAYENLQPNDVTIGIIDRVKWFYVRSTKELLSNDDVVHISNLSHDGVIGCHPAHLLTDTFEYARVLQTYRISYFKGGSHINGVITVPIGTEQPEFEAIVAAWQRKHNVRSAGRAAFLPFGATYANTTADNEQTQLAEMFKASENDIARVLLIHPTLIYAQINGTLTGLEGNVIKSSIRPYVKPLEDEYAKLFTPAEIKAGCSVKIDTSEYGDTSKFGTLIQLVNAGLIKPNEAREEMDYEPIAGGDVLRMPVNVAQPLQGVTPIKTAPDGPTIDVGAANAPESTPAALDGSVEASATPAADAQAFKLGQKLGPILSDVAKRVETKTRKAYESHKGKEGFSEWVIEFGNKQGEYLRESLSPIIAVTSADFTSVVREYEEAVMNESPYPLEEKLNDILSN